MGAVDLGGSKKAAGGPSWKRPRVNIRIDMTPMVDIAFLLLIFFMVTTVFRLPQTMEMALPDTKEQTKTIQKIAEKNLLTVYVMRLGEKDSLAYRVGNDSPKPLSWALLGDTLVKRREIAGFTVQDSVRKPNLTVLAKIDRKASYESLVNLVDQFNVDSVNRFSIDKYNTMDDSLMRAAGFTTAGPKGLPEPPQAAESSD
ncbi:MAG TPA: biopolymer transporter ExbD [bacterium]|jgi:biopolymer transport protein ExbD